MIGRGVYDIFTLVQGIVLRCHTIDRECEHMSSHHTCPRPARPSGSIKSLDTWPQAKRPQDWAPQKQSENEPNIVQGVSAGMWPDINMTSIRKGNSRGYMPERRRFPPNVN